MLDVMRRNIKSLAVTLWAVIGAFILFIFVDWGMGRVDQSSGKSVVATINDKPIYADAYRDEFASQVRRMRDIYRDRWDDRMISQMGLDSSVLERLISQEVIVQEAERMGLTVSDAELREAILSNPSFQDNGKFIGMQQYERLLMMNHKTAEQFEEMLRRDLLVMKLRELVTLPLSVSDREAKESYHNSHEKVKISYIYEKSNPDLVQISDAELREYFEKNRAQFDMPERRKGRYVQLDAERVRQQVNLSQRDIESYYNENIAQFRTQEEVHAQKIVLTSEKHGGKDAAHTLASKLVERAGGGEDFAKLAKESSDDPTATSGGDTGPLFKGGLAPAEEAVVFETAEGSITTPVESESGWVVYKIIKKIPESVRPLKEAEQQIRSILSWQKAREALDRKTTQILKSAQQAKSLDQAAKENGLSVKETPPLAKGDETPGLSDAGQLSQALFAIGKGEINGPVHVGSGTLIYTVVSIEAPRPSKYEEVAEKVKKALSAQKRRDEAVAASQKALDEILAGAKPEDVAKKIGTEVKEYELTRNSYVPDIGNSSYIDDKAFALDASAPWTGPVPVKEGACVFKVIQKTPVAEADFEKEKDSFRDNLVEQKRNNFFDSYVQLLKKKRQITIHPDTLQAATDSLMGRLR